MHIINTDTHTYTYAHTQVPVVKAGALKPLVTMMSVHAQPRHYAGLALLKLADNPENHLAIAEEGGIQGVLRLARAQSTDEELQYKGALAVGHLASNAMKMLPGPASAARKTGRRRKRSAKLSSGAARNRTQDFLDRTLNETSTGDKSV